MFGIKSEAREKAFARGFFAMMIKDDMNLSLHDDLDVRSQEELVVVDGVTTTRSMTPPATTTRVSPLDSRRARGEQSGGMRSGSVAFGCRRDDGES